MKLQIDFDLDDTVELPAVLVRRRAALRHGRRASSETSLLRAHSMRCQQGQGFAWVPLIVFAAALLGLVLCITTQGDSIIFAVGTLFGKVIH